MAKIERFEDIQAWQKARMLVKHVYSISNSGSFTRDFGLRDQIRRAAVSIMLNIAEGFARKTKREFSQFLIIAHGSAAEVQSALYVALDQGYLATTEFDDLYRLADEVSKMIMAFSRYLCNHSNSSNSNNSINSNNSGH
ncbi:four helix bundle protein [Geobacter sp. SVR]|uniref:four helix bundle protein n=1 Tax=Geobacter sp. SVR TaxID=2495594 RepID=UPI00143EF68E|nr:four helix bundle protein [Geobacter sp. SVR]BCS54842.1 four helix bundle protein [Geobacter sp. SVR]GCF86350.1 four helix bundle protein [Geobacter sp. SVR]